MAGYLLRRAGQAIVVLFVVTVLVFLLVRLLPGGPAEAILGRRATPAAKAEFNHLNGYDRALPVQYAVYVGHLFQGDLGYSYKRSQSVTALLGQTLPKTLLLVGVSTLLAALLAVPLGILQAVRRNRPVDYVFTGAAFIFYAMPSFWLGLVLVELFAVRLGWFPPQAPQGSMGEVLSHPSGLVLPVATLALVTIAQFSRYMRSSMLEQLSQDYVRTARARGVPEWRVVVRHALSNALVPVVTLLGLSLPWILGGALVVESVFNFPGTGLLFWNAAQGQDYAIMLGVTLVAAIGTVVGSLFSDLMYAALDPRVRYD
ncbi:ABC transporter permease [Baekduia soli]|uniref:ABC transporter permease n=1 Tax=Baekduia soli TaxID=496014 RepID=A0A5B8UCQ1_9ACTN|nr:ABC transporter permease [Baekduia soli]QEC50432.1 ABC transporter permease [Baekduia soli]